MSPNNLVQKERIFGRSLTSHFLSDFLTKKMQRLKKCHQNLVRSFRHCNKFAKIPILVQTC